MIERDVPISRAQAQRSLHAYSPDKLLGKVIDLIASSQAPIRSISTSAPLPQLLQAEKANIKHLINENNVFDYAPVGCLENTMCGNDRSGTVDNNLNLIKAVELALCNGRDLVPFTDEMTGKTDPPQQFGPATGDPTTFTTWEEFWQAYAAQTRFIIQKIADLYERTEAIRARFHPTPYLSCLVRGCAEKGLDVTQGGAEISSPPSKQSTYATTVDSLLAIKYLVFDNKICTMNELLKALKDNWIGHEVLQAKALNKPQITGVTTISRRHGPGRDAVVDR